jgi:type I restriction enzyme S subunit
MSDWNRYTLEEVCSIYDGPHATPAKRVSGSYFLSISSLQDGRLDLSESAFLSEEDYVLWTKRVTPTQGDIVFSYETRLGQAAMIPSGLRCCLGRRMGLLRTKDTNIVDPSFLLHYYLGAPFQQIIKDNTVFGTTVDRIPLQKMGDFEVLLPPLPEQKKIAEILSSIDNAIIIYEQQAKALENLLDALMREKIVMNASTRWIKIGAACTAQAGGTPDRSVKRYYEGNIPWVKSGEVKGGNINHTDESISEEAVSSSPAKIVPAGSVLIAMYGATAGQTARLRIDATTNQAVLSLNSSTSELTNDYLYHAVTAFKGQLLLACQGSGQPNLSSGLIKELEIPLPDLFAQNRISSALDSVNHRALLLRSKICSTMALKSSVSADLLSGRKRVTL